MVIKGESKEPQTFSDAASTGTKETKPKRKKIVFGAIALGVGLVSVIPTPYQVGGNVQLAWRENARQSVHTPIPAIVDEVLVQPGEIVQVGQPLLRLYSHDLDREIAETQEKLSQAYREMERAQQEYVRSQAALLEVSAQEQVIQEQASFALERAAQVQTGDYPPEIQQLIVERQRLEQRLQEAEIQVERYSDLEAQGIVPRVRVEEQETLYRDIERDLAVKAEQIHYALRQIEELAVAESGNVTYQDASVAASQMLVDSTSQMDGYQQAIAHLEERLQELEALQTSLTLTASTEGTILSSDLDLYLGREVQSDTELLQIADLDELTANVEIQEEDLDYVQIGAPVTFRPRQAKLESYDARVEDILYNVEADETKQQRVATVRLVIENPEERLRPGSSGYAKIFSEWIPLYERVGRELLKLIPERFL
jgi:multidrug resistance efflux pump